MEPEVSLPTKPVVLLVEDSEAVRTAYGILLRESGYEVHEAANGKEALTLAQSERPDVVVLDLGLPDVRGLSLARELKSDPSTSHTSILAVTGRALEADREACLAAGCAAYFAKPVETAVLLRAVGEAVGRGIRD